MDTIRFIRTFSVFFALALLLFQGCSKRQTVASGSTQRQFPTYEEVPRDEYEQSVITIPLRFDDGTTEVLKMDAYMRPAHT